ncbi:MAG: hypothetical protein QM699_06075 [Amaricoccus sp.]|uniref:hypothetical protein n=1 Tax=Amaricoccus sp. TaxID=1872485 RepID=UPI0039E3D08C
MRRRLSRLLVLLAVPLVVVAMVGIGYAGRPSSAEAAFQVYLLLGGDAADLCGHGPGHLHCDACSGATPALASGAGPLPDVALVFRDATVVLSQEAEAVGCVVAAAPRGPPGAVDDGPPLSLAG